MNTILQALLFFIAAEGYWLDAIPIAPPYELSEELRKAAERDYKDLEKNYQISGAYCFRQIMPAFERRWHLWIAASWMTWPQTPRDARPEWRRRFLELTRQP